MSWLDPGGSVLSATSFGPGEPVQINVDASADALVVRKPDGTLWAQEVGEASLIFPETDQQGVYEVSSRDSGGENLAGRFAVNLMSDAESKIAPAVSIPVSSNSLESTSDNNIGQRELWPWFVFLALLVLMIEWWAYHRGARLPNRGDWYTLTGRRNG
jgi:hypothetical protein